MWNQPLLLFVLLLDDVVMAERWIRRPSDWVNFLLSSLNWQIPKAPQAQTLPPKPPRFSLRTAAWCASRKKRRSSFGYRGRKKRSEFGGNFCCFLSLLLCSPGNCRMYLFKHYNIKKKQKCGLQNVNIFKPFIVNQIFKYNADWCFRRLWRVFSQVPLSLKKN